jgi:site-specific DNA recombinase
MKAVGYVRVSTEEQARGGVSLDMQRAKIRAYAALEDMELVEILADEGISGCSIKIRPGIQQVLQMVREKRIDAVIIYKLDRLARNTVEALEISRLMDRKNIGLHSITEKLDTRSAMGRFFSL